MPDLTYRCPCGAAYRAGLWGTVHWHEILTHHCRACGATNTLEGGRVLRSLRGSGAVRPSRLDGEMMQREEEETHA